MDKPPWVLPPELDPDVPNAARIYDYLLGGAHNFPADREAAERVIAVYPEYRLLARVNRGFLGRAVRYLLGQGIKQFLDIGSGIPTAGNVHEIAHRRDPSVRIVYVDIDPVAVYQSQALLENVPTATAIREDARHTDAILNHAAVRSLLDFDRPVGLLLAACLMFIRDDDELHTTVGALVDALAPGSYVVISHPTWDGAPRESVTQTERLYEQTANPFKARSREDIADLFDGLELVEPGITHAPSWHPDRPDDWFVESPERSAILVGVGRKPARL